MKLWLATIAAAAAIAVGASACSSNSTSSPSSTTTSPRSFEITTPNGQISVSLDGKLPPNWPSSFPTPSGTKPAGSGSLGGGSTTHLVAIYSSTSTPADVIAFYTSDTKLTTSGETSIGSGSSAVVSVEITAPYTGQLTALSKGNATYLVVNLEQMAGVQG